MIEKLLSDAVEARFREEDLKDCFLVAVETKGDARVEVYIDSDSSLSIDTCRKVSRHLEHLIEENGWLGEKYTLDVSSPGLDRPLTMLRQYRKNVGRQIKVVTIENETIKGTLAAVSEDQITVKISDKRSEEIAMENIKKAKILVSFK